MVPNWRLRVECREVLAACDALAARAHTPSPGAARRVAAFLQRAECDLRSGMRADLTAPGIASGPRHNGRGPGYRAVAWRDARAVLVSGALPPQPSGWCRGPPLNRQRLVGTGLLHVAPGAVEIPVQVWHEAYGDHHLYRRGEPWASWAF